MSRGESEGGVARLIVRCLENEGVSHVFGIPGEENIHLVEALSRSSIRYVLVRHEQAASFMAEVHGRLTSSAVRLTSCAPPGTHSCRGARSPVRCGRCNLGAFDELLLQDRHPRHGFSRAPW